MRFSVLGHLTAHERDREIPLGGPRQRAVLALLLVEPGRAVSGERLLDEIWGDSADAKPSLYTYISNLRRLIGTERIDHGPFGYRLVLQPGDEIDAVEAERAINEARSPTIGPAEAAGRLADALRHWTGTAYSGLEDVPTLGIEQSRLSELRAGAEIERIDDELRAGHEVPIAAALALRDGRPHDERAWALLVRSLYRVGRQTEALRTIQELRGWLRDELGLDPSPAWTRLEEQILVHDPALDGHAAHVDQRHRYLSSFIGRASEVAEVERALDQHHLVTITGPGGAGKTRLAVELLGRRRQRQPGGTWLVDLARLSDDADVMIEIATALRAPGAERSPLDAIGGVLAGGGTVIIDNAEGVRSQTADAVQAILRRVTSRILVTSRVPLGSPGEHVVRIHGLPIGESGCVGEAEELFAERCRDRGADVDPADPDIRAVCERLDGIPLALELAASRSTSATPREISTLLDRRFAVLVDPGQPRDIHRSLEATVGWSYGLLDPDERAVFDALGMFDGPFSVEAAAAATGIDDPRLTHDALHRLVSASLVTTVLDGDRTMYRLLETLREYARDRLAESGRWEAVAALHDRHFEERARVIAEEFLGRGRVAETEAATTELACYLAAWDRLVEVSPLRVLPIGWVVGNVWLFQGRLAEGERRLTHLLDATAGDRSTERGDVLMITSWVLAFRNRTDEGRALADEGLAIYRASRSPARLAFGCARAGHWAFILGDAPTGMALLNEAMEVCDRIGFDDGKAWPTALIAQARRWSGDTSPDVRTMLLDARRRFIELGETYGQIHADMLLVAFEEFSVEERLAFATEMVELSERPGGENLMRPIALHNLAYAVERTGDDERARGLNRAAVRSSLATGASMDLGLALLQGAEFAAAEGDFRRAAILAGAGRTHFAMELAPFQRAALEPVITAAAAHLGAERAEELQRIGRAMSAGEAADVALAWDIVPGPTSQG